MKSIFTKTFLESTRLNTSKVHEIILCFFFISIFSACNQTKYVPEGEYLLESNDIVITQSAEKESINKAKNNGINDLAISPILKQPANRTVIIGKVYLWLYNRSNQRRIEKKIEKKKEKIIKKNKRRAKKNEKHASDPNYVVKPMLEPEEDRRKTFGERLRNIGEAPVILDSAKIFQSSKQIRNYLLNIGYFNASVRDSVVFLGKSDSLSKNHKASQKAKVFYIIEPGKPHNINSYTLNIENPTLKKHIDDLYNDGSNSFIKVGAHFDSYDMDKERKRITDHLRDEGYYFFNKEFIFYKADSIGQSKKIDLTLNIQNYKFKDPLTDSVITRPHNKYKICKIDVFPNYRIGMDTNKVIYTQYGELTFVYNRELKVKLELIHDAILFKESNYFSKTLEEDTYKKLNALGVFRSVSIKYDTVSCNGLKASIYLELAKSQSFTVATDGTHTAGLFGIEGSTSYTHNNLFGGAERLQISLTGGIEMQRLLFEVDTANSESFDEGITNVYNTFNTIEFGPKVSLTVPRFLFIEGPLEKLRKRSFANPKTEFAGSVNYQNRPDFKRNVEEFTFGYIFQENPKVTVRWYPLILSAIGIQKSVQFQQRIDELNDRLLAASYQDHIIAGGKISYTYNGQEFNKKQKHIFFGNVVLETAGNLVRNVMELANIPLDDTVTNSYEILGIRYAQFVKVSGDFRYHYDIPKIGNLDLGKFAVRLAGGIGLPLENLKEALPFEKSFFAGGSNGIRAWKVRSLGPGSFLDTLYRFDKIGDIQLEANLELRFPIIDWIEGALFTDIGNIWTVNPDPLRPGGQFKTDRFLSEIAVGSGLGIRLDLDFFVIRLDVAMPIKNPALEVTERWIWQNYSPEIRRQSYGVQLNIGIGYPF